MYPHTRYLTATIILLVAALALAADKPSIKVYEFEDFGMMVQDVGAARVIYGPGQSGKTDTIYLAFGNMIESWFMMTIDTATGQVRRLQPSGSERHAPKGFCVGADERIYASTVGGHLYVFDPQAPEDGITDLGKVCSGEGYLFALTSAPDGRLYMGTYPGGKLLTYDPAVGEFHDYGSARKGQMYTQSVAPFSADYAYADAGVTDRAVVRYNLKTGDKETVSYPEQFKDYDGPQIVRLGRDDNVYCYLYKEEMYCRIDGLTMTVVENQRGVPPQYGRRSIDGYDFQYDWQARIVTGKQRDGTECQWSFDYTDAGSRLFMMDQGPDGTIYGSSYIPLILFSFDMKTRTTVNHGNPFHVAGGEIYTIHTHDPEHIYMGAYGDADIVMLDGTKPFQLQNGKTAATGTNPLYLGTLGDGQNRPYTIITGPDDYVYIATTADYGEVGGAVTKLDPRTNTWQVFRHCVPGHAIVALESIAGNDRLLVGGTLALATGQTEPQSGDAKLFIWDTHEDRVIYQTDAPVSGMTSFQQFRSTDDGRVVGFFSKDSSSVYFFAFDPLERRFLHHRHVSKTVGGIVHPCSRFSHTLHGQMLLTARGRIFALDTDTYDFNIVAEYPGAIVGGVLQPDPGRDNRLAYYFITDSNLVAAHLEP